MKASSCFAPGKIILSGEYAVVFGYPGIAVPANIGIEATFGPRRTVTLTVDWHGPGYDQRTEEYVRRIIVGCEQSRKPVRGTLTIRNQLPIASGMGSSTALVIAIARALLGDDCHERALEIEDEMNPDHSGLDFAVIWGNRPIRFRKSASETTIERLTNPFDWLARTELIDTGKPNESTPELVAWVKSREKQLRKPLQIIGNCAERLLGGEDPRAVFRDHHRAQLALGVVPQSVEELIANIEKEGSAAKVIGAGGRTGGGGMVLRIN